MVFTPAQRTTLEVTERVSSVISLLGSLFIFTTFISSKAFRKPFNRLILYASMGNIAMNIGSLIGLSGIRAGQASSLCQFQGFLIQMFVPADAYWNLIIAVSLYLTLYRNYNAEQLQSLSWKFFILVYGIAFTPAVIYCFLQTPDRGKVYAPAGLWCWVGKEWDYLRLVTCYGPAWFCIAASFFIYILVGWRILAKRSELHFFNRVPERRSKRIERAKSSSKVVTVNISYERNSSLQSADADLEASKDDSVEFEPYTVKIEGRRPNDSDNPILGIGSQATAQPPTTRSNAMNTNAAAWAYIRCAMLFFVALLITWVPSSINRVYTLLYRDPENFGFNYGAALVLPLMGFWNCLIYITISWTASKVFCSNLMFFF